MQCSINSEDKMLSSESNWFLSANFEGEDLTSRFTKKRYMGTNTSDKYDDMDKYNSSWRSSRFKSYS